MGAANMVKSVTDKITPTYEDERLAQIEKEEKTAIAENEKIYKDMAATSNNLYDQQIAASEQREQELLQQQQDRTDFTLQQIEQQKEQAQKDYTKEQSAAYVDWQKQSNPYGANAENMAANGLTGTGYSESSQVAMYTAYQNRVASAKASYELTKQDFNNAITEAMLKNDSALAEIAYAAQQERLTLTVQKFQQNNEYLLSMLAQNQYLENLYYQRRQSAQEAITEGTSDDNNGFFSQKGTGTTSQLGAAGLTSNIAALAANNKAKNAEQLENINGVFAPSKEETKKKEAEKEALQKKSAASNDKTTNEKQTEYYGLKGADLDGSSPGIISLVSGEAPGVNSYASTLPATTADYNSAVSYLKQNGITDGSPLTATEWTNRRNEFLKTGKGSVDVSQFNTYKEYLQGYVMYKIATKG